MNPILLAALHGYVKGYAVGGDPTGGIHPVESVLFGPIREEMKYRAALSAVAPGFGDFASAAAFAFAHYDGRQEPKFRQFKVLDAFAGGLIYAKAFREYGLAGAVIAHGIHNLMTSAGANQKNKTLGRYR